MRMADRVNTRMHRVEPTGSHAPADRTARKPALDQLMQLHHALLLRRQFGDPQVT